MDRTSVLLAREKGSSTIGRLENVVSLASKHRSRNHPNALIVLDEEDRLRTPKRRGRNRCLDFVNGTIRSWQVNLEGRPLVELAVDPNVTSALLHDAEHGREPEP